MLHCAFYRIVAMARIHEDYWCVYWMDTDDDRIARISTGQNKYHKYLTTPTGKGFG